MNFGIDFGTTNSAVVLYNERTNTFDRIGDASDINTPIASMVSIDKINDQVAVGLEVRRNLLHLLENEGHLVVGSVKSFLDSDEVRESSNRAWNAEEIAAELFCSLKQRAFDVTGHQLEEAVVAIPVGMNAEKRRTLRRAAQRAGIRVTAFVSEPTAAFIAHLNDLVGRRYVLVFDWGGGTLDISVLERRQGSIVERYTEGLHKAGDYIDDIVAQWAHGQICQENDLQIAFENLASDDRQGLLNEAERVKLRLQQDAVASETISLWSYGGLKNIKVGLTKEKFESLILNLINEALDLLFDCVERAGVSNDEISNVLIVGGSSKLRLFRAELEARWNFPNLMFPNGAEWDIANGAARLASCPGSYRTSDAVGLELADGKFYSVMPEGTSQSEGRTHVNLGLVEDTQSATVIFATRRKDQSSHATVGEMFIPCKGFLRENIRIECEITSDLIFAAYGESSHIEGRRTVFEFDRLRWKYDFGGIENLEGT